MARREHLLDALEFGLERVIFIKRSDAVLKEGQVYRFFFAVAII